MRKCFKYYVYFVILLSILSCNNDGDHLDHETFKDEQLRQVLNSKSPTGDLSYYELPDASDYEAIPQDPRNPITQAKVDLGRMLFHETGLGVSSKLEKGRSTFSCASCHQVKASFQAGAPQGIGEGGLGFGSIGEGRFVDQDYDSDSIDVQPLRSPTILNTCYQTNMLWNGQFGATGTNEGTEDQWTAGTPKAVNQLGFEGIETQAIAGLAVHRLEINQELLKDLGYENYFDLVYYDIPKEERYSAETAGLAIAAYERTILSNQAPFQQWLKGKAFLSNEEIEGALLFFGKAKCDNCHTGPALNSMSFHALGMEDLDFRKDVILNGLNDGVRKGRGGFTGREEDNYKFKTPQLYNLFGVKFLGHGSSFSSIREVIEYKNFANPQRPSIPNSALSEHFIPLDLNAEEIRKIESFILLSLYDSKLERYVPEELPSGNCFPNADQISMRDLGCN